MKKSIFSSEYKVFTDLLIEYREKKGLLQEELAKILKTSQVQISRYEKGQVRLDIVQISHYLAALDVTLSQFVKDFIKRLEQ